MFKDRADAGSELAKKLLLTGHTGSIVIGLARGGVVVSKSIADTFGVPNDVLVVKKIGSPGNPELAIGAVAPDGISYIDDALARVTGADEKYIQRAISAQSSVVKEKTNLYRNGKPPLSVKGKSVILTDDGAATGATMYAAVEWAALHSPQTILVALPVAPPDIVTKLRTRATEVIVLETPGDFGAVGEFYRNFPQLSDEDVIKLLT